MQNKQFLIEYIRSTKQETFGTLIIINIKRHIIVKTFVCSWFFVPSLRLKESSGSYNDKDKDKDKDKDLFIGPQEFVVGYSKAPEQPQSSARPICHSHTVTRTGREPATVRIAA